MSPEESSRLTHWVRNYAPDYLTDVPPNLVTDAEPSRAVRLRWFRIRLSGTDYKAGLNIHYGGSMGGFWITNIASDETADFHPHLAPRHGFGGAMLSGLQHLLEGHQTGHALRHKTFASYTGT